ncbi:MAG: lipopolysaccharide kinase InaA family protein [Verrucomicrobiota bacterium]
MNCSSEPVCKSNQSEISWVRVGGEKVAFVDQQWSEVLREAGLRTAEDFFSVAGEPLSKPGLGKRYRARLALTGKQSFVYLKRYEGDTLCGFLNRWYEDGQQSTPAEREVNVALSLRQQNIAATMPVAYGRSHDSGLRQKSFVLTAAVPGDSLEHFFRDEKQIAWKEKLKIIEAVASFARKFHENGWRHRDFYLCHIFINKSDAQLELTLIDLARVFRPRWRKERWRIKDLAQLNYSASAKTFSRSARMRFAHQYFGCEKLSSVQKNRLRKIIQKTESIARHDRKVAAR